MNVIRYNVFWDGSVKPLSATLCCGAEGKVDDNSIPRRGEICL